MGDKTKHLKLSRALEDELKRAHDRPSWESGNEGVHERVNFDDTIWGFNLAGGAYYKTPLRVTNVREGSRAEHAGIKPGDLLTSINNIDTKTLSIQEAHDIIYESGIEIKLAVAAPDVDETTYFVYQDSVEEENENSRKLRSTNKNKQHKVFNGAKVNDLWSMAWPSKKKRDIMYKESNCFLVPSKYQEKHKMDHKAFMDATPNRPVCL